MVDGILDLLTTIFVLGIVVAICFGFILSLADPEYLEFESQYEDKAVMEGNFTDYSIPAEEQGLIINRKYTYEEMLLLLSVQDNRMEFPRAINIRNLVTTYDLSYKTKTYWNTDLNSLISGSGTIYDEALHGIVRYADNHLIIYEELERTPVYTNSSIGKNVGTVLITDTFNLERIPFISELNGAEQVNAKYGELQAGFRYLPNEDTCRLSGRSISTIPDADGDGVAENRIYYIAHHFPIPDDSPYVTSNFKCAFDDEGAYFVEVKVILNEDGAPINSCAPPKNIDTYADYQKFLKNLRASVKGNK